MCPWLLPQSYCKQRPHLLTGTTFVNGVPRLCDIEPRERTTLIAFLYENRSNITSEVRK